MASASLRNCFQNGAIFITNNKSIRKSMPKKSWKSKKNDASTDLHFDKFRNCFSWKIELSEKGACTKIIRLTNQNSCRRGFAEKEGKQTNMKICKKIFQKMVAKKEGTLGEITSNNWCTNHETTIPKLFTKADVKEVQKNENEVTMRSRRAPQKQSNLKDPTELIYLMKMSFSA